MTASRSRRSWAMPACELALRVGMTTLSRGHDPTLAASRRVDRWGRSALPNHPTAVDDRGHPNEEIDMQAKVGDRIVITGHESLFFPGSDAAVEPYETST
jgi:hypothetical protein